MPPGMPPEELREWLLSLPASERRTGWRRAYEAATLHWVNARDDTRIGPDHPECCPLIRSDLQWGHRQVSTYLADGWGSPYLWAEGGVLDQYERERETILLICGEMARLRRPNDGDDNGNKANRS